MIPAAPAGTDGLPTVEDAAGLLLDLGGDHHVHSIFSDDATSSLQQNLDAATAAGLHTLCATDHVRASTTWVPEFLAAVTALHSGSVTVLPGVETKILDAAGHLDLPTGLRFGPGGLDRVLIADHQFPGPDGPVSPRVVREQLRSGSATASDLLDTLVTATISATARVPSAQLAHPFSLLPKIGLSEDDLSEEHLTALGAAAVAAGCRIEVNEKWACPGPRALRMLARTGVTLVASTDSHTHDDVGRYRAVRAILASTG